MASEPINPLAGLESVGPAPVAPRRGFSLAALVLLVAGISVFLAAARSSAVQFLESPSPNEAAALAALALVGGAIGIAVGLRRERWFVGGLIGGFTGATLGSTVGSQLLWPPHGSFVILGPALLLGISLFLRWMNLSATSAPLPMKTPGPNQS
jgi:hypothetical protein